MKKRYLFLIFIICLFAVSAVSATEISNDTNDILTIDADISTVNEEIIVEQEDVLSTSPNNKVILDNNKEWYVNASATGTGDGSIVNPFNNLREALDNVNDGDTIYIASGIYEGYGNIGLSIVKQVKIKNLGSEIIFDGNSNHIFTITQNNTEITGIILKNGFCSGRYGNGGAISCSADLNNISIINCSFINNKASSGGAISFSNYLNDINIINCSFVNNSATTTSSSGAGAIALGTFGYNITIKDCYFFNNSARNHGGAIYCFDINNCTFENLSFFMNTAQGRGGGINIYDSGNNTFFKNILVINNFAGNYAGGAVYCSHLFNSNFELISFINNSCVGSGGAISFRNANNVNLSNSLFLNNTAFFGGAINYFGGNSCIINCSFIDNSANQGGAIYNQEKLFVFKSNFIKNNATEGSAIMWDSGNGLVNNSIFINNKGIDTGTIHIFSDNIVVFKSIFINNTDPYDIYSNRYLVVADYNWFGNNETNYNQHPSVNSNVVTDSWLFLNATANSTLIPINNNSRITFKLDSYNSNSQQVSPYDASKMNVQLDLSQTLGELNHNTTFFDDDVIYTAKQLGYASITGKFETTSYTIKLKNTDGKKENLTISAFANSITVGEDATVVVTGLEGATGDVSVTVDDKIFTAPIRNGEASVSVSGIAENVTAYVDYVGDDNYNPASTTVKITVNPNVIIYAPDVTKYYGGPERFIVTLTDLNGNPIKNAQIKITINGRTSEKVTDDNGIASMGINLNSGVYITTTEYNGTKVNSTVTIKDTVIAKDFTKIYRNGTQYQGTFVDSQGNLIRNTDIEININGVFYTRKTNDNGVAQMNINLPPGTYILTATNPLSKEQHTTKVTVLPNIVENHDLTKYYKNASQYSLRLLDDKGNPVGAGVSIQLNINGVFYTRTSDANGYVKMNINLPPGTYIITAEYKGLRASNTIKVLSVLETKDLVMKYKDGSKFEAKILDGQGKPYAGQTVTFNINGVFYTKNTEADGIARLKINLLAGEYIITSMYNGLNSANKVTISG